MRSSTGQVVPKSAGRSSRRYKTQLATFRSQCQKAQAPCWLCDQPIDYNLRHPHPDSFQLDHAIPVSADPGLAEDPANFRPAHGDCNARRGTGPAHIDLGTPSENW